MATTNFTTNLALALPTTGDLSGTWGSAVNTGISELVDQALGYQAFSATGGSDTLTIPDAATGVARSIYIQLNGTGGGTVNVPATKTKMYFVFNNTASAITFKVTGQTGVSVPAAAKIALVSNGTDIITAENYFSALTLGSALPVASGGTGLTAGTSGGVLAYTATGTLASSTALAASALVIGGGAGAAPSTTTTGTGVVTALGVNTGTAGAFVVNGGALGSPSSVGTMPAFTLGGTVSGGGNQINNVIIGTSTPLAGAFTTVTASTAIGTASGGTGLGGATPFTSSGVVYASSTSALATGSALTFDGSNFGGSVNVMVSDNKAIGFGFNAYWLGNSANGFLAGYINGSEGLRLKSTGLGIGTTSPVAKLQIRGSGTSGQVTASWILENASSGTAGMDITGSAGASRWRFLYGNGPSTGTNALTESMCILTEGASAGNLGIGTSSPTSQLTVGAATANPASTVSFFKSSTSEYRLKLTSSGFNSDGAWLGLGFGYHDNYMKAAIIAEAKDGNARANLHFSLNSEANSNNAGLSDSKMVLTYSGNLGLGVTPSAWASFSAFQFGETGCIASNAFSSANTQTFLGNNVYYDTGYKYIATGSAVAQYIQIGSEHRWNIAPSGTAGNAITFTQAMTLDASGNLLVGTTSASGNGERLNVTGSSTSFIAYLDNTSTGARRGIILTYSGSSPPNDTGNEFLYCNDTSALRMTVRSNGGIANYSANDVNLSDRREKTNFAPAKSYLDVICAIPVQTFNYIDQNMEDDGGLTLGVVAQDVQAVAPEFVMESNWGTKEEPKMRLSIYQTDLQYALMKCIQEQQAIIESLKARFDAANL